ncbi:MAG: hypothetical protein ABWU84_12600 [Pyrobaculum sp.]|uniref:hypothetical protein n=1 Tax=Pyrobaculum sp. TaxID=2004705 RepID=UPI003EEB3DD0
MKLRLFFLTVFVLAWVFQLVLYGQYLHNWSLSYFLATFPISFTMALVLTAAFWREKKEEDEEEKLYEDPDRWQN